MTERRSFQFLNVMRFISAVWVVLFHMASSPLNKEVFSPQLDWLRKGMILPFSGLAAVMVFFVISGFCIHYPYVAGKPFQLLPFYLQRFTRIGLPLLAAWGIHAWWGTIPPLKNVLWSVYCELIYYALYPLLKVLMARVGVHRLLAVSLAISWLICLRPDSGYGHVFAYGHEWTWLICLPVWLCGCVLANWLAGVTRVPGAVESLSAWMSRHLVLTRASVWVPSSLLLALGMRELVPFKYSLPIFGLLVLVWFVPEMRRPDVESWLSRCGVAGYSIYLMHPIAETPRLLQLAGQEPFVFWPLRLAFTAVVCAVFYFIVEMPSHRLARLLGAVRTSPLPQRSP